MNYPCKECTERKRGCHNLCEKYLQAKAESEAVSVARQKARSDDQYHMDTMTKYYSKRLKERKRK